MLLAALLLQVAPPQRIYRPPPCHREVGEGSRKSLVYRGDRICVDTDLPRIYEGVWIDEFEGQSFAEGATTRPDLDPAVLRPWFNTREALKPFTKPRGSKGLWYGRLYKVRFVGRQAVKKKGRSNPGYDHFRLYPGLVILDEMLSIEPLDAQL
ncbi:hypothetical protein ACFQ15_10785 [Sphingomonas hankookensis]|uniref:hypothetical protein n=1 Tax=Sphingomonas hankookensis TaxID=563996 RepID=UPI001F56C514|nr:hypothetical protein [Sphingomonas hankookensis]